MQITVARAEPALALGAVIISPLQEQRPQHALKRLAVATMILSWFSADAIQLWAGVIAGIGIQPLFQRSCRQTQSLPSCGYFNGFEVQIADGLAA
jgi:hypothetical protein